MSPIEQALRELLAAIDAQTDDLGPAIALSRRAMLARAKVAALSALETPQPVSTSEKLKGVAAWVRSIDGPPDIGTMVDRFLCWPLPKTFAPDCGISFDGRKDDEWNKNKTWPTGTNLLTAAEAKAMFEHALAAAPSAPTPSPDSEPQPSEKQCRERIG